jgi:hypothetical protein
MSVGVFRVMTQQESTKRIECKRLTIVLIKPSKYDDEGYVIRHFRGVLPSNTLACLCSLTEDLNRSKVLGNDLEIRIKILDDMVQKIPVEKIIRSNNRPHCRTVIALVGVQSNQFPRAADIARRFRVGGLQVLIGGFHVSGTLSLFPDIQPEIQELINLGVTVVKGEVEETWGDLLADAHHDRLHPNFAPGELYATYRKAWLRFYSFEHMRQILTDADPGNYWNVLRNYIWYKNSVQIEGGHPMIHGFSA